jgi:hypothetical protein
VYSSTILALGTGGKSPWYPLDRRLDDHQSRSGRCVEKKILALPGIEPGSCSPLLTELSRLYCELIKKLNIQRPLVYFRSRLHYGDVIFISLPMRCNIWGLSSRTNVHVINS